MIIPRELSSFTSEDVLLLVTGKQDAKIFRARRGILELIDDFKIETPVYSDKETHFLNSTAAESIQETVVREFSSELQKRLKRIAVTVPVKMVYVFTPSYFKRIVLNVFPTILSRKIHMIFEGNYYHEHPLVLIKRISDAVRDRVSHEPHGEAKRILDLSERARTIVRHKR